MERVFVFGLTELSTMVRGHKDKCQELVKFNGPMALATMADGRTVKCMDVELYKQLREFRLLEHGSMICFRVHRRFI